MWHSNAAKYRKIWRTRLGTFLEWLVNPDPDVEQCENVQSDYYCVLSGRISRNIGEKPFDLTLVPPVKIPIFTFLLPMLIASASQPDGNMTSFTLHEINRIFFSRWKIEIYFIPWTLSVIFSRVAKPLVKILPMVSTRWNKFRSFIEKKKYPRCIPLLTIWTGECDSVLSSFTMYRQLE